jgi:prevent-host-death family protein
MPDQIGIRELRDHLTNVIRRVRAGETIEITHHHQRVAVLTPPHQGRIGRLHQASDITPGVPPGRPLRSFPATTEVSASAALAEDRAER